MINVAIVDADVNLRKCLTLLMNSSTTVRCVASFTNLLNIVSDLKRVETDIVLMDVCLPHITGIEGIRTIKDSFPDVEILMFAVRHDQETIFKALREGASGYLLKDTAPADIMAAIHQLYNGGAPLSPCVAKTIVKHFHFAPARCLTDTQLTAREKEILYSLADGLSYQMIANKHIISISTIRSHICHIYRKLNVHSKTQAIVEVLNGRERV